MSIPPLGIYSEKIERGRLQSSVRMVTTIWRIWLITSSASCLKFMLLIQTIITCLRNRFCIRTWSSLERSKPFVKPYNDTDRCFHKAMIYILKSGVNTCLQMQELNLPVCICITYHSLCSNTFTFLYLTEAKKHIRGHVDLIMLKVNCSSSLSLVDMMFPWLAFALL